MVTLVGKGITEWSRREPGEERNHHRDVRFDVTDGAVGITAFSANGDDVADRVLLTSRQFASLIAFVNGSKRR